MKMSEKIDQLSAAMAKAQGEMPRVPFDSTNPGFRSRYASLGANIEAARPVLAKHGLAIVQNVIGRLEATPDDTTQTIVGVETVVMHESGQWMSEKMEMSLTGSKRNTPAQEAGAIITYLRRYAFSAVLSLYSDEDVDGNQPEAPRGAPAAKKGPQRANRGPGPNMAREAAPHKQKKSRKDSRPYSPKDLKAALEEMAERMPPATKDQQQFAASLIGQVFKDKDKRHEVQEYLFGAGSLTEADPKMVSAAMAWLDPQDGAPSEMAIKEMETGLHDAALLAKGQMPADFTKEDLEGEDG